MCEKYLEILNKGLKKTQNPKKITVVGAGMAGLIAAKLLSDAGHQVVLLEANNRVGGRIKTLRENFSEGLHAEVGAMRIPIYHQLTMNCIKKYNLNAQKFNDIKEHNNLLYHRGEREYINIGNPVFSEVREFPVAYENGSLDNVFLAKTMDKVIKTMDSDDIHQYDKLSLYHYLKEIIGYSEEKIEKIGLLMNNENLMHTSLIECVRDFIDLQQCNEHFYIKDGMDRLPGAIVKDFKGELLFNASVESIYQDTTKTIVSYSRGICSNSIVSDYLILAIPFTVLRHIDVAPLLSDKKSRAVRQINYSQSTKIFMEFNKPFWQLQKIKREVLTDLPLRYIRYPDGSVDGPCVLLVSYTWGKDAMLWDSFGEEKAKKLALNYLSKIHGDCVYYHYVTGVIYSWQKNIYSMGAFSHFYPGQQTSFYEHIIKPEGKIHFAGEHASLKHGWIEGAVESGIRVAMEIQETNELVTCFNEIAA